MTALINNLNHLVIFQKLLSISADNYSKWDVIKNDKELKVYKIKVSFLFFNKI